MLGKTDLCRWNSRRNGGEYDSDVFVYIDGEKRDFVCSLCSLVNSRIGTNSFRTPWLVELKTHMEAHSAIGETVPDHLTILLNEAISAVTPQLLNPNDQIGLVKQ